MHLGKRIGEFLSKIFSKGKSLRVAQDGAGKGRPCGWIWPEQRHTHWEEDVFLFCLVWPRYGGGAI